MNQQGLLSEPKKKERKKAGSEGTKNIAYPLSKGKKENQTEGLNVLLRKKGYVLIKSQE